MIKPLATLLTCESRTEVAAIQPNKVDDIVHDCYCVESAIRDKISLRFEQR